MFILLLFVYFCNHSNNGRVSNGGSSPSWEQHKTGIVTEMS